MGPLQFYLIRFEGNRFSGQIMPRLNALREDGVVRILDLVFVQRDAMGEVTCMEMSDLDEQDDLGLADLKPADWFALDDMEQVGNFLPNQSSAAMVLVEHLWAIPLQEAIQNAGGELLADTMVHRNLVAEVEELVHQ